MHRLLFFFFFNLFDQGLLAPGSETLLEGASFVTGSSLYSLEQQLLTHSQLAFVLYLFFLCYLHSHRSVELSLSKSEAMREDDYGEGPLFIIIIIIVVVVVIFASFSSSPIYTPPSFSLACLYVHARKRLFSIS